MFGGDEDWSISVCLSVARCRVHLSTRACPLLSAVATGEGKGKGEDEESQGRGDQEGEGENSEGEKRT